MIHGNRVIKNVEIADFKAILDAHHGNVFISSHALDHLSNAQRHVFSPETLKDMLLTQNPAGVGIQGNGNYSAFFRLKDGYRRIILKNTQKKLEIVTFMNTDSMPNLSRL